MGHPHPNRSAELTAEALPHRGGGDYKLDGFAWFGLEDERSPYVKKDGHQNWRRGYFH